METCVRVDAGTDRLTYSTLAPSPRVYRFELFYLVISYSVCADDFCFVM